MNLIIIGKAWVADIMNLKNITLHLYITMLTLITSVSQNKKCLQALQFNIYFKCNKKYKQEKSIVRGVHQYQEF